MGEFIPSVYQSAIFEWALTGKGHAVVKAVPGSGKTTTLIQTMIRLLQAHPGAKLLYAAFGKAIQEETNAKLAELGITADCMTLHSIGNRILTGYWKREHPGIDVRFDKTGRKYRDLAKDYLRFDLGLDSSSLVSMIVNLVIFCRNTLTEPTETNLLALIDHYNIDIDVKELDEFWGPVWKSVGPVMENGRRQFLKEGVYDFGDMIWLPNVLPGLTYPQYDYLLADECQDFNKAQTELVKRLVTNGRILFCGDPNQSIFGFTGADTDSIPNIIAATNAQVFPLSICYRCPTDVVGLAAQVYPGIEAGPNAPKGIVQTVTEDEFIARVKPGDMVLCRTNAPLVSNCLRLLRAGVKAQVRGRDIGKQFKDLLEAFQKRVGFSLEVAPDLADQYRREQLSILMRDPDENEYQISLLNDKVDTFKVLLDAYLLKCLEEKTANSIPGFNAYVDSFFCADEEKGEQLVLLCTGHKAKGLEKERVWVLEPGLLPHPAAKKPWQRVQEDNLLYVIVSRAKYTKEAPGELYFVGGKPAQLILPGELDGGQGVVLVGDAMQAILTISAPVETRTEAEPEVAQATYATYERQEAEQDAAHEELEALRRANEALHARIAALEAENQRLRALMRHEMPERGSDGGWALPNHLKPKVGRTLKAPEHPDKRYKGAGRRQPLQLSLDPLMIGIIKSLRMNASGFFEEKLEAESWYQDALAARQQAAS